MSRPAWVLDTNTVVSGLLWDGAPARLLDHAADGDIVLASSPALIAELTRILGYRKFASRLAQSSRGAEVWISHYAASVRLVEPAQAPRTIAGDPDDDQVLACALAAHAQAIVSGDHHLLDLRPAWRGIHILTARQALARVRDIRESS